MHHLKGIGRDGWCELDLPGGGCGSVARCSCCGPVMPLNAGNVLLNWAAVTFSVDRPLHGVMSRTWSLSFCIEQRGYANAPEFSILHMRWNTGAFM